MARLPWTTPALYPQYPVPHHDDVAQALTEEQFVAQLDPADDAMGLNEALRPVNLSVHRAAHTSSSPLLARTCRACAALIGGIGERYPPVRAS